MVHDLGHRRHCLCTPSMAEETEKLYAAIFGTDTDSSSSSSDDGDVEHHAWRPVLAVPGLWRYDVFLSPTDQKCLLHSIEAEGWFADPAHNQAMRFGTLPPWAVTLSALIRASAPPPTVLAREPLFDQMIVNVYQPGEGIGAHVDLARFEDGIAVASLLSACVMRFRRGKEAVDVMLRPGDVILLSGSARYEWTHEISRERREDQVWEGAVVEQGRRISVTLRRLCPEEAK